MAATGKYRKEHKNKKNNKPSQQLQQQQEKYEKRPTVALSSQDIAFEVPY